MRILLLLTLLLASAPALSAECPLQGPPARFESEFVDWRITIGSGQRCLRGLRWGAMTVDEVKIVEPAKSGEATAQGYGFAYQSRPDFKGDDAFAVKLSGVNRGVSGSTTIRVHVTVR